MWINSCRRIEDEKSKFGFREYLTKEVALEMELYGGDFKDYLFIYFLERGEGREKEKERNINVWLPLTHPQPGTRPATQACALTGNRNSNPLVLRSALHPLSHTSHG